MIVLPDNWNGDMAADLSVLVHEMVHHLQKKNQLKYECPWRSRGACLQGARKVVKPIRS
jgi:hypothetical protein